MNLLNNRFVCKLSWIVIGLFALFQGINYLYDSQRYTLKSQKTSPDGERTIYEFNQLSDGRNHAPYGTILSLSSANKIRNPEAGYIFLACYCKPLNYSWQGNDKITVSCHSKEKNPIRTQANFVHGIKIDFKIE